MEAEKGKPIDIAVALRRQNTKHKKYDALPTDREGSLLRVEQGARPDISPKDLGSLVVAAAAFRVGKTFRDKIASVQQKRHDKIQGIAARNDGVRGVVFTAARKVLNIIPKHTIKWDNKGLKTALGGNYGSVVSEHIRLSAVLPLGAETSDGTPLTPEKAKAAVMLGLVAIGLVKEDMAKAVTAEPGFNVDEGLLHGMVQDGQVPDIEKAGTATETWAITIDPFKG